MQLKKDDTPNTENLKLNDDGFFNTDTLKADERFVSRISNDYSRTGNNTNYVGTVDYEYDEKIERNAFRMTEEDVKKAFAPTKQDERKKKYTIFFISEIILYLVFIVYIFFAAKCCIVDQIDIYYFLKTCIPLTIGLIIYLLCDTIFIFAMGEKKGGLFVMALLFPFYPFYRKKVIYESNIGVIPTIMILFAVIMTFVTFGTVKTKYENVMYWEDKTTRHYMVELMDQELKTKKRLGTMLLTRFDMNSCDVSIQGNHITMVIEAKGNIKVDDVNTKNAKIFDTELTYERFNPENDFELTAVTLDGKELSEIELVQFQTKLETNTR